MSLVECRALECRALRPEPTLKPMQAQRSVVTLKLLESIEAISSSRDRDVLAMTVTAALHDFFAPMPKVVPIAVELRDRSLLTRDYAAALDAAGVRHCVGVHPGMPLASTQARIVRAFSPGPLVVR